MQTGSFLWQMVLFGVFVCAGDLFGDAPLPQAVPYLGSVFCRLFLLLSHLQQSSQLETAHSAAGLLIDGTRKLFGGTRAQGLRTGTSRFLSLGWLLGWKLAMSLYCVVWAAHLDRGRGIEIRIYLATWTLLLATVYFIISTISVLLCMAYLARERPRLGEDGKPLPHQPSRGTRSAVPFYFRWTQHFSWVIACILSLITTAVYWLGIYDGIEVPRMYLCVTILACLMVVDQFFIQSEFKIKATWLGLYFLIVYLIFNLIYYYESTGDEYERVTLEVWDWERNPGRAVLWLFLMFAIFLPAFGGAHLFFYRLRERIFHEWEHELVSQEVAPEPEEEEEKKPTKQEKKDKKAAAKEEKKKKGGDVEAPPAAPVAPVAFIMPDGQVPPAGSVRVSWGAPPPDGAPPTGPPPAPAQKGVFARVMDVFGGGS